ncbi:MAG: hypothetical protein WBP26_02110 [Candidatus Saccharimonadales bacterium]
MSTPTPTNPEKLLTDAKQEFHCTMLGNDAFLALVAARLRTDEGLPKFSCEPRLDPQEDGSTIMGVSLQYSRSDRAEEVGVALTMYDAVDLFHTAADKQSAVPAPLILHELETVLDIDPKEALVSIVNDWQVGWNGIARQFGSQIGVDPFTKTVALISELERMSYAPNTEA